MLIVLTNAVPGYKGDKVAINADYVISVRPTVIVREDGTNDAVTIIFTEHGTWEVMETMDEVVSIFPSRKNNLIRKLLRKVG